MPMEPCAGPYFKAGDAVRIRDGTFEAFEGEVIDADYSTAKVTVKISIFGQSTPVELENWRLEMV